MLRLTSLIIGLCIISLQAQAVTLREQSVISDGVIRVKDIFHGVENNADNILGAAPRPGTTMHLDARTLNRVAVAMDLAWRPATSADSITIKRAATIITASAIEKKINNELGSKIQADGFNLIMTSGSPEIILPPSMSEDFEITNLNYNPKTRWFEAKIAAPSQQNMHTQRVVTGKVDVLTNIPTLNDTFRNGDVITKHDVHMIAVPSHTLNHDTILRAKDLYGRTPRRMVMPSKPITENDVQQPQIVSRGDTVTMTYNHHGMTLTSMGKALENGAKGDMVRIVNHQSSKTIDAVVTGDQEVTIAAF